MCCISICCLYKSKGDSFHGGEPLSPSVPEAGDLQHKAHDHGAPKAGMGAQGCCLTLILPDLSKQKEPNADRRKGASLWMESMISALWMWIFCSCDSKLWKDREQTILKAPQNPHPVPPIALTHLQCSVCGWLLGSSYSECFPKHSHLCLFPSKLQIKPLTNSFIHAWAISSITAHSNRAPAGRSCAKPHRSRDETLTFTREARKIHLLPTHS